MWRSFVRVCWLGELVWACDGAEMSNLGRLSQFLLIRIQIMSKEDRPNIILIITDQQRYETIRALGYDYMDTPNLDRMVDEGVAFTQCHITAPSCALRERAFSRERTRTRQVF